MDTSESLMQAIVDGDEVRSVELTKSALADGVSAEDILKNGLIPGIRRVGELFNEGEYFLPELIVSGKAMEDSLAIISPLFASETESQAKRFLIGTVKGDIHDIGKKVVSIMLKGNGWKVTDLGVDLSAEDFCRAVSKGDYDVVGMSSLLTMSMPSMEEIIRALEEEGLREKVKVMVGGAPVTQGFADAVGADAYGSDAWEAVLKAEQLMQAD